MGHIGNTVQTAFTSFDKQTITGTGTAVYTLSHSVANEQEIEVFVNNVRQEGGSGKAFTVSGNQITFSENIASTDTVYVNFQGKAVQTVTHPSDQPLQATTGTFSSNVDVGGSLLVDTIKEGTGTNTAMTIDSDGLVLMPQRPHFFVHKNSAQGSLTAGDVISFQTIFRNNGSHWDTSNHKFVAPVDGVYMFCLNWLSYNGSDTMDCSIAKNGTYIAHSRHPNRSGITSSNHATINLCISYYLDANDEIDVRGNAFSGNSTDGIYGDSNYWTTFSGHLVG